LFGGDDDFAVGGEVATLFEDTDGKVYFNYASAARVARLKDDFSGLAEDWHPISCALIRVGSLRRSVRQYRMGRWTGNPREPGITKPRR
jgi:hypothetical protein